MTLIFAGIVSSYSLFILFTTDHLVLIPYPINECFKTPNEQTNVFPSYNFYCNSNGEPELRTYKDTLCD